MLFLIIVRSTFAVCVFVIIDNKKNTYLFFDKSSSCIAPLSFVSSFEMDAMANHLSLFLLIFFFLSSMTSFFLFMTGLYRISIPVVLFSTIIDQCQRKGKEREKVKNDK